RTRHDIPPVHFRKRLAERLVHSLVAYRLYQVFSFSQFAERDRLASPRIRHLPVLDAQTETVDLPLLSGKIEQQFPGSDCHAPELRSHRGRGAASERAHIERRQIGVTHHKHNGLWRRVKLLRHSLGKCGAAVLSDLDFTGEDRDLAVLTDVQPG